MHKQIFILLFFSVITFSYAQQELHKFDDVVEIGNFFEQQMCKKNKTSPDPGVLFWDYDDFQKDNYVSLAGTLHTHKQIEKVFYPEPIITIKELKKVNLKDTMIHEIRVSNDVIIKSIEILCKPLKIKDAEQLKHAFYLMEKNEKLQYYRYLKHIIAAMQQKLTIDKIDKELIKFIDLKNNDSFIKRHYISLKNMSYSIHSKVHQIDRARFVKYAVIFYIGLKLLV